VAGLAFTTRAFDTFEETSRLAAHFLLRDPRHRGTSVSALGLAETPVKRFCYSPLPANRSVVYRTASQEFSLARSDFHMDQHTQPMAKKSRLKLMPVD